VKTAEFLEDILRRRIVETVRGEPLYRFTIGAFLH
jgi:hypothetical protein